MNFRILLATIATLLASAALTFAQAPHATPTRGPSISPQQPGVGIVPNLGGRYQGSPGSALPTLPPGSSIGPSWGGYGNPGIFIPTPSPWVVPTNPTPFGYPNGQPH